jgi:hypothetical protein
LEFQLNTDSAINIAYAIVEDSTLDKEITFEFKIDGQIITDWVTVDQATTSISVLPVSSDLVGTQKIDVKCSIAFTDQSVWSYLVSDNIEDGTLTLTSSFEITITSTDEGPDFEDALEDQVKRLGEYWTFEIP